MDPYVAYSVQLIAPAHPRGKKKGKRWRARSQRKIRFGAAVARRLQGRGAFVDKLCEDGPLKVVTLCWISCCRLLATLPCLSSP
ncbi:hypothetical protein FQA47_021665 [Oryzias melastigma]|uniref:Uncharacterized protein n=1 Tax=Oryzias melastigma TaxID=30732 RepID=A0A834FLQ0_ORYME|nr:hypothetical protein FQA47_021665 [Oryzias melastigma]